MVKTPGSMRTLLGTLAGVSSTEDNSVLAATNATRAVYRLGVCCVEEETGSRLLY